MFIAIMLNVILLNVVAEVRLGLSPSLEHSFKQILKTIKGLLNAAQLCNFLKGPGPNVIKLF
jgi:hypothetical protein